MTRQDVLTANFVSIETDARFTQATVRLRDGSVLSFRHRVGERWVRAIAPEGTSEGACSHDLLGGIRSFRLNAKHLEIRFDDGSSWEWRPARPA